MVTGITNGKKGWVVLSALLFGTVACSDSAGPDLSNDEAETAQIEFVAVQAEAAMADGERSGRRFPLLARLVRATRQAIEDQGGHPEGEALLAEAQTLAMAARDAFQAGDTEEARTLIKQSHEKVLEAVAAVLGQEAVEDAVETVAEVLNNVLTRLEGRDLPERVQAALAMAEEKVSAAQTALGSGDLVGALENSIQAAHLIHALTDRIQMRRQRAQSVLENANRLLRIATHAAGDSPSDGVAQALAEASDLLDQSRTAFQAGNVQEGTALALASASISIDVIRMLRGDDGG